MLLFVYGASSNCQCVTQPSIVCDRIRHSQAYAPNRKQNKTKKKALGTKVFLARVVVVYNLKMQFGQAQANRQEEEETNIFSIHFAFKSLCAYVCQWIIFVHLFSFFECPFVFPWWCVSFAVDCAFSNFLLFIFFTFNAHISGRNGPSVNRRANSPKKNACSPNKGTLNTTKKNNKQSSEKEKQQINTPTTESVYFCQIAFKPNTIAGVVLYDCTRTQHTTHIFMQTNRWTEQLESVLYNSIFAGHTHLTFRRFGMKFVVQCLLVHIWMGRSILSSGCFFRRDQQSATAKTTSKIFLQCVVPRACVFFYV